MSAFELLKTLHIGCAIVSAAGFALRSYWVLTDHALRRHRLTRIIPHTIDTVLLGSAIGMLWIWQLSPLHQPWLMAKIIALLVYIGLGMVTMRFGKTRPVQAASCCAALLVVVYIVMVAVSKSPWGPLALL